MMNGNSKNCLRPTSALPGGFFRRDSPSGADHSVCSGAFFPSMKQDRFLCTCTNRPSFHFYPRMRKERRSVSPKKEYERWLFKNNALSTSFGSANAADRSWTSAKSDWKNSLARLSDELSESPPAIRRPDVVVERRHRRAWRLAQCSGGVSQETPRSTVHVRSYVLKFYIKNRILKERRPVSANPFWRPLEGGMIPPFAAPSPFEKLRVNVIIHSTV